MASGNNLTMRARALLDQAPHNVFAECSFAEELELVLGELVQRVEEYEDHPVCATHDLPCEAMWVCRECASENPALDEAVAALNEAHREIRMLEAQLRDER